VNQLAAAIHQTVAYTSREGYIFHIDDDRWILSKDITIPLFAMVGMLPDKLWMSFRLVLALYAKKYAPSHSKNMFERCKHYLEATPSLEPFSPESLLSYRSQLDSKSEWYLGSLRGFIRQWDAFGYAGVPEKSLSLLDKWTLKGNEKGFAVQSMCPDSGPFTDIEMAGMLDSLTVGFSNGLFSLEETCYAMTLAMTGRRPGQITAIKLKDLRFVGGKYFINFPQAKQRGQGWRVGFKRYGIVEDLWLLLQEQAAMVQRLFAKHLYDSVPEELIGELPLFPRISELNRSESLREQLDCDRLHAPNGHVTAAMSQVAKKLDVLSERTGLPIWINPTRFRYTLGTNLGREGHGEFVIAEALGHSDTQNAGVYVRNSPEIVERLNKAVALQLAPIAQAFQGVLVKSERDASRGSDRASRISNGEVNLGSCGSYGFCSASAPIACYTCSFFQPWLDGPHESFLDTLIADRDLVMEQTGDIKVASVNDRLILAVGDVVDRCRKINSRDAV
jgi:hypothetical protein